ncbi:hypothetical protein [Massilia glaciei]|uniref:hypothetical protein n=1 Tax=Massilia glaciei TaxID=1524097 RepID=UPI001E379D76|nr:hypothetical protein [Massilia glaciei]
MKFGSGRFCRKRRRIAPRHRRLEPNRVEFPSRGVGKCGFGGSYLIDISTDREGLHRAHGQHADAADRDRDFDDERRRGRAAGHREGGQIKGYSLAKRTVYITDEVYGAVYACASAPPRDAMDLAYLTGQRPADALRMPHSTLMTAI